MLENDGRVVSNFVVQALKGIPLTVYGDGSQTRSFCYVSDLVEGLMRLMNGEHIGPINLGNPGEYTILELAKTIRWSRLGLDHCYDLPFRICLSVAGILVKRKGWSNIVGMEYRKSIQGIFRVHSRISI